MKYALGILCLAAFFVVSPRCAAQQLPMSNWINVKDYGAKGDGKTDDSASVLKAVLAASARDRGGGNVVYFAPSTGPYLLESLVLPTPSVWVTLYFDASVTLRNNTFVVPGGYILHGNTSGPGESFSHDRLAQFAIIGNANPTIYVKGPARLENLLVQYVRNGSDGIVVETAGVTLKNVWVDPAQEAGSTSIPLIVKGGFNIDIEGGGYSAPVQGTGPSILLEGDGHCHFVGPYKLSGTFLASRGVLVRPGCDGMTSVTFEHMLTEGLQNAFLTIQATSTIGVWALSLSDIHMADSQGNPLPPLVDAHCSPDSGCAGIWGMQIVNGQTDGPQLTTGDTIYGLEVWNSNPRGSYKIAQSSYYVLHMPWGIYNAMPTYQLAGAADFSINISSAVQNQTVAAGQTATYPLSVVGAAGFDGVVDLSCSGALQVGMTCSVAPSSVRVTSGASVPITATITTAAGSVSLRPKWPLPNAVSAATFIVFCAVLILLGFLKARFGWVKSFAMCAIIASAMLVSACAGVVASDSKQSGVPGKPTASPGSPHGSFSFYVVGTSAGANKLTHQTQINITIN